MSNKEDYKKWATIECPVCKTKFELWVATSNWFSSDFADYLRENFYRFCPVCKTLEELEKER